MASRGSWCLAEGNSGRRMGGVPGTTHAMLLEAGDVVADRVREFLGEDEEGTRMKVRASDLLAWLASVPTQERDAAVKSIYRYRRVCGLLFLARRGHGRVPRERSRSDCANAPRGPRGRGRRVRQPGIRSWEGNQARAHSHRRHMRGIEIQPALVERARRVSTELRLDVSYIQADARHADLADGTVFFLYVPFTGSVLRDVLRNLRRVATDHAIVVCSLGVDLDREAPWLSRRPSDSFWLTLYDSVLPSVPERRERAGSPNSASPPGRPGLVSTATAIAYERPSD